METITGKAEDTGLYPTICIGKKIFDSLQTLKYNNVAMTERQRLIDIIRTRSFQYNDDPIYPLSSGAMSKFYFNMKMTFSSGEAQFLIGKLVFEKVRELKLNVNAIGGLTMGADPIAYAVSRYSYDFDANNTIEAFVIRKEAKPHGLQLQVEGNVKVGDHVIIVDDVVTTGTSTIKAIDLARKHGLIVQAVIVLVDRGEQNGRQKIEALGLPVYDIFTIDNFLS
jgi:orotate phosphoribosyltransferase